MYALHNHMMNKDETVYKLRNNQILKTDVIVYNSGCGFMT